MRVKDFYTYSVVGYGVSSRKSWSTKEEAVKALHSYFKPGSFNDKKKRAFKYAPGRVSGVVYHYHHYSDEIPYACEVLIAYEHVFYVPFS